MNQSETDIACESLGVGCRSPIYTEIKLLYDNKAPNLEWKDSVNRLKFNILKINMGGFFISIVMVYTNSVAPGRCVMSF